MKRSEALKLIANQLDFLSGDFKGVRTNFTKSELDAADVILTTLEEAGMKAPDIVRPPTSGELEFDDRYPQDMNGNKVVNEWEPEDRITN